MEHKILVKGQEFKELFNKIQLNEMCCKLAGQLYENFKDKDVVFLVILNGAYVFATDLLRLFPRPVEVQTMKVSSYDGMKSTGELNIEVRPKSLRGRNVVIVEDIIETGFTMGKILDYLKEDGVESVEVCALFLKPGSFKGQYPVRYVGKEIGDEFIVGYGFDIDGFGRNLPCVYQKL